MIDLLVPLSIWWLSYLQLVSNANILVVLPVPSRSHFTSYQPLFEELIKRDHNLTIIAGTKLSEKFQKNYTHIDVSHITADKAGMNFAEMRKQGRLENFMFCNEHLIEHTELVMQESAVQRLLRSDDTKFDLVMIELFHMDVYAAFGYHFKAPVIGLSAQALISFYGWLFRNPTLPSYMPNVYLPLTDKMSFTQRLWNAYFTFSIGVYHQFVSLPRSQKVVENYFPFPDRNRIPKLEDLMRNISLVLVNYHFAFEYAAPFSPNVIQTAGLHITEPDPLPKDLQTFMDNAAEGVIYVSLGSLIRPEDLDTIGTTIIRVLQSLPQKVIFKWNPERLPLKPDNFLIQAWAPQIAILSHPNCRLFITHGGLHSLLESVNYSVPIVGVPFFTDQQHNLALVEYLGIGKKLDINFSEDQLSNAVHEVLANPSYYQNIALQSKKFNDRIISPLNTAVYWVEYVLRHKESLRHLRPASRDLLWYQYFLLDVLIFVLLVSILLLVTLRCITKMLYRFCKNIILFRSKCKIS